MVYLRKTIRPHKCSLPTGRANWIGSVWRCPACSKVYVIVAKSTDTRSVWWQTELPPPAADSDVAVWEKYTRRVVAEWREACE